MTRAKQYTTAGLLVAPLLCILGLVLALCLRFEGLGALCYWLFWLVLPGRALRTALLPRAKGPVRFVYSFLLGCALVFGLYYLGQLGLGMWPLRTVPPAVGAVHLLAALRTAPPRPAAVWAALKRHTGLLWLVAGGMLLSWYILVYSMPVQTYINNADYLWHMGNVHTLAAGFEDIRVLGMTFRYHYFSDLVWACGALAVGLDAQLAILRYAVLFAAPLCVCGVYAAVARCTQRRGIATVCAGLVLFLPAVWPAYNDAVYQWAGNVNAVGFAWPCALALLLAGMDALERQRAGVRDVAAVLLLSVLCTGFKGPFTPCVLAALVGGWLVQLWQKKRPARGGVWVLAAGLAGFVVVWALLLRGALNEDYLKSFEFAYSVYTAEVLAPLLVALGNGLAARLVLLPLHMLVVMGPLAVCFVAALCRFGRAMVLKRQVPPALAVPLAGCAASLVVFYLLNLSGRSQFYFLYMALPFAGMLAACLATRLWQGNKPTARRVVAGAVALAAVVTVLNTALPQRAPAYPDGEVAATLWLRDNAGEDALVATNRHGVMYLASGLSGCRFYLEGDTYARNSGVGHDMLEGQRAENDALFLGGDDAAARCRELGITHLLQYDSHVDAALTHTPGEGFFLAFEAEGTRVWIVESP